MSFMNKNWRVKENKGLIYIWESKILKITDKLMTNFDTFD